MTKPTSGVAVTYTGREDPFIERNYGSGLAFEQGQTRVVPEELAAKLLRHADVFATGDVASVKEEVSTGDDTEESLKRADAAKKNLEALENQRQDVVDRVSVMDKEALKEFAKTKYGQPIPKTMSVENMRAKVIGFIDQFGLV